MKSPVALRKPDRGIPMMSICEKAIEHVTELSTQALSLSAADLDSIAGEIIAGALKRLKEIAEAAQLAR